MDFAPTTFTQGGVNKFISVDEQRTGLDRAFNRGREGF